jgi:hypothetical protein
MKYIFHKILLRNIITYEIYFHKILLRNIIILWNIFFIIFYWEILSNIFHKIYWEILSIIMKIYILSWKFYILSWKVIYYHENFIYYHEKLYIIMKSYILSWKFIEKYIIMKIYWDIYYHEKLLRNILSRKIIEKYYENL